jgi:hypothetical protein
LDRETACTPFRADAAAQRLGIERYPGTGKRVPLESQGLNDRDAARRFTYYCGRLHYISILILQLQEHSHAETSSLSADG